MMIACVCPVSASTDHSINTLRYANRLKEKQNRNYEDNSGDQEMLPKSKDNQEVMKPKPQMVILSTRKLQGISGNPAQKEKKKANQHKLPMINTGASAPSFKRQRMVIPESNENEEEMGQQLQPIPVSPKTNKHKEVVSPLKPNSGPSSNAWTKNKKLEPFVAVDQQNKGKSRVVSSKHSESLELSQQEEENSKKASWFSL